MNNFKYNKIGKTLECFYDDDQLPLSFYEYTNSNYVGAVRTIKNILEQKMKTNKLFDRNIYDCIQPFIMPLISYEVLLELKIGNPIPTMVLYDAAPILVSQLRKYNINLDKCFVDSSLNRLFISFYYENEESNREKVESEIEKNLLSEVIYFLSKNFTRVTTLNFPEDGNYFSATCNIVMI